VRKLGVGVLGLGLLEGADLGGDGLELVLMLELEAIKFFSDADKDVFAESLHFGKDILADRVSDGVNAPEQRVLDSLVDEGLGLIAGDHNS
jgi:hypothetical protein